VAPPLRRFGEAIQTQSSRCGCAAEFRNLVACPRISLPAQAGSDTSRQRDARRKRREESSCHQQGLVADKVKPNPFGPRAVKEERRGCLDHILAQFVPGVRFGEDAFRKAFGAESAVGLLDDLKHQFRHTSMIRDGRGGWPAPCFAAQRLFTLSPAISCALRLPDRQSSGSCYRAPSSGCGLARTRPTSGRAGWDCLSWRNWTRRLPSSWPGPGLPARCRCPVGRAWYCRSRKPAPPCARLSGVSPSGLPPPFRAARR
jgi:hypothetical protein